MWCVLEDRSISIVDMNIKYNELVTYLESAAENIDLFMSGQMLLYGDKVKKDRLYDSLLIPRDFDHSVYMFLDVILRAFVQLGRKLYKDQLPGGKLTELTPERQDNLKGVPKTSCFAESVFGQLDNLMQTKPNLKTLAAESCIMFANNKTLDWLQSKQEEDKKDLMEKASKGVKELRAKFKVRLHEIEQNRRIAINEKVKKRQNAEREKIRKQEVNTNDIIKHGLWQSEMEIDNMLRSYEKESEKVEVLKSQLRFRKEVLLQVPENKSSFNFSKSVDGKKSRKSLNSAELSENLKALVRQAIVKDKESCKEKHILVEKRVRHRFREEKEGHVIEKWYTGKIISQVIYNPFFKHVFGKGWFLCFLSVIFSVCSLFDFCASFPLCVVGQCMESDSFFPRSLQLNIFSHFLLILEELTVIVLNLKQVVIQKHLQKAKAII